jgi:hypothetical protein
MIIHFSNKEIGRNKYIGDGFNVTIPDDDRSKYMQKNKLFDCIFFSSLGINYYYHLLENCSIYYDLNVMFMTLQEGNFISFTITCQKSNKISEQEYLSFIRDAKISLLLV